MFLRLELIASYCNYGGRADVAIAAPDRLLIQVLWPVLVLQQHLLVSVFAVGRGLDGGSHDGARDTR